MAGGQLAELKGLASSTPNQAILINTLGLQKAQDSSAIDNLVTTQDELSRASLFSPDQPDLFYKPAAKEVRNGVKALRVGYGRVQQTGLLTATVELLGVAMQVLTQGAGGAGRQRGEPGQLGVDRGAPFGQQVVDRNGQARVGQQRRDGEQTPQKARVDGNGVLARLLRLR